MNQPTEKFEGELVITADRELDFESPLMVSLIDHETGQKTAPGPILLEYLAMLEEIRMLAELDDQSAQGKANLRHRKLLASSLVEIMGIHEKVMSKRMFELVTEGRVKAGIWIDSVGGNVEIAEKVKFAIDYLRRNGMGTFSSYVNIKAASAAFDLAFLASEVNAMTRSVFNWHFSDSAEDPRLGKIQKFRAHQPIGDQAENELGELRDILEDAKPEMRDDVWRHAIRQLNDPTNEEGDIFFDGDLLHEAGLVDHCYRQVDQLLGKFKADFPLHADKKSTFFTEGVSERVARTLRSQPYWLDSKALHLTTRVARQLEAGHKKTGKKKLSK